MGPSLANGGGPVFSRALDACRDTWLALSVSAYGDARGAGVDTGDKYRRIVSQTCLKIADRIATHQPTFFFADSSPNEASAGGGPRHPMLEYALAAASSQYHDDLSKLCDSSTVRHIETSPTGMRYAVQCLYRLAGHAGDTLSRQLRLSHLLMHALDQPSAIKVRSLHATRGLISHIRSVSYINCVYARFPQSPTLRKAIDSALRLVASSEVQRARCAVQWLEACVGVVKSQGGDDGNADFGHRRRLDDSEDDESSDDEGGIDDSDSPSTASKSTSASDWSVSSLPVFRRVKPRWQTKCHSLRVRCLLYFFSQRAASESIVHEVTWAALQVVNHLISLESSKGGVHVDLGALREHLAHSPEAKGGIQDYLVGHLGKMVRLCCNFTAIQVTGDEDGALLPVQTASIKVSKFS